MKPVESKVRTVHAKVIKEIGLDTALVLLGIARDLRSGVIPPHDFNMKAFHSCCGTSHCIGGWAEVRTGVPYGKLFRQKEYDGVYQFPPRISSLFSGSNPSDPCLAAAAIERYVYDYSPYPWASVSFNVGGRYG